MIRLTLSVALFMLMAFAVPASGLAAGPSEEEWNKVVDRAIDYLKKSQSADGTWSQSRSPGITGVVLTGALETGRVKPGDEMAMKALKSIESLVNPKAGHIAGADPKVQLQNYVTSVNVMALRASNSEKYKSVIADAATFLKKLQW